MEKRTQYFFLATLPPEVVQKINFKIQVNTGSGNVPITIGKEGKKLLFSYGFYEKNVSSNKLFTGFELDTEVLTKFYAETGKSGTFRNIF